jgi:hypothetical protein
MKGRSGRIGVRYLESSDSKILKRKVREDNPEVAKKNSSKWSEREIFQ